ncbi:MAG TPA: glycosyltransferase family 4 protein [Chthoniobacterales bacterium]|jgi:glycosyltransferase involved in cell wall biosynthesis
MKILISSHAFAPSLGGIETVSQLVAQEFVARGHEVRVITQTAGESRENFPVIRRPPVGELLRLIKWCDIFWQNNLSLRTLWPMALRPKPVVVTHQGSYCLRPTGVDGALRLKRAVAGRLTGVAISQFVADCLDGRSTVIPNPYDARVFRNESPGAGRNGELLFVGRLVSEKGIDLLLEALSLLRKRQLQPSLTIVGAGPEGETAQKLAGDLGFRDQVKFAGPQRGEELARTFHSHRILVVPSRYDEPFGVVALEGIACGCVVAGSRGGGLAEAIGPCGLTFPNGDAGALADVLEKLLCEPDECDRLRVQAPQHLVRFHPATIADQYLDLFRSKLP